MSVCMITSFSENNRCVFDLSIENHRNYCTRHGYTLRNDLENYSPYINVESVRQALFRFDMVVLVGADILIVRPELELSRFVTTGVTMAREYLSTVLNGDFIIFHRDDETKALLKDLSMVQDNFCDGQTGLNHLFELDPEHCGIKPVADLQIACPEMNPRFAFDADVVRNAFSLHFHTMGERPDVTKKARYMKSFLQKDATSE